MKLTKYGFRQDLFGFSLVSLPLLVAAAFSFPATIYGAVGWGYSSTFSGKLLDLGCKADIIFG